MPRTSRSVGGTVAGAGTSPGVPVVARGKGLVIRDDRIDFLSADGIEVASTIGVDATGRILVESRGDQWLADRDRGNEPINVLAHPYNGDIQAAFDAAEAGDTVVIPAAEYTAAATLEYPGGIRIKGGGLRHTIIRQAAGANLHAIMAPAGWLDGTNTSSVAPVEITGLQFDGQSGDQTDGDGHGLVVQSYFSSIEQCEFFDTRGDGARMTTRSQDGSATIGNTMVETRWQDCRFLDCGGYGFNAHEPDNWKISDGFLTKSLFRECGARVDSSAGWHLAGNHLYEMPASGLMLGRMWNTIVLGNYLEPWGQGAEGVHYAIDGVSTYIADDAAPSLISSNVIRWTAGTAAAGSTIRGIGLSVSNGTSGHTAVVGNALYGATHANTSVGVYVAPQSESTVLQVVEFAGNIVRGFDTPYSVVPSGPLVVTGDVFGQGLATSATDGFARLPGVNGAPAGTPSDLTRGVPMACDETTGDIYTYVGGAWVRVAGIA